MRQGRFVEWWWEVTADITWSPTLRDVQPATDDGRGSPIGLLMW